MKVRIISAIVLLAISIPILIIGKLPFAIFMAIAAVLALHELLKTRRKMKELPFTIELYSYILAAFFTLNNYNSGNILTLDYRLIAFLILVNLMPLVFVNNKEKYDLNDALFLIGSTLFIGLAFNLIVLIRDYNIHYVAYLFLITIITDTFALITGKYIGKHKLAPKISPNKTIEGLIGGAIMGTFVPTMYYISVINSPLNIGIIMAITLFLSLLGQFGDLVFSFVKREFQQKDFSNLIPGHGGILDRLDSIIFVVLGFILFITIL